MELMKYFKARPNGGFWSVSETHTDKIPDRVGALNELRHYTKDADNLKSDKSKLNLQNGQKVGKFMSHHTFLKIFSAKNYSYNSITGTC